MQIRDESEPQPTSRLLRGALTRAMLRSTRRTATAHREARGSGGGAADSTAQAAAAARSGRRP